jgi:hypothetical protein
MYNCTSLSKPGNLWRDKRTNIHRVMPAAAFLVHCILPPPLGRTSVRFPHPTQLSSLGRTSRAALARCELNNYLDLRLLVVKV